MAEPDKWITAMQRLLKKRPVSLRIYGMDGDLFSAGPEAQAIIGDQCPASVSVALSSCSDFVTLGRITSSGGW